MIRGKIFSDTQSFQTTAKIKSRGFGRSATTPKSKGLTGPTSRLLADITSIVSSQLRGEIPLFLMGHSMGGTTVFTYACEGPVDIVAKIRGFLGEAPDFGFPLRCPNAPSQLQLLASKLGKYVMPRMQVVAKLHPETLSPDSKIQTDYVKDALCHETVTVEGISGHFERIKLLNNGTFKLRDCVRSIWVGCSPEDLCVSYDACAEWIKKLDVEDKELRTYNGWSHSRKHPIDFHSATVMSANESQSMQNRGIARTLLRRTLENGF
jgi:acylglycerol lipase